MVEKPPIFTRHGTLILRRYDEPLDFYCTRCDRPKRGNLIAKWVKLDGTRRIICNGCYGNLLAKKTKED